MKKRILPIVVCSMILVGCSQKKEIQISDNKTTKVTAKDLENNKNLSTIMYPKLIEYIDSVKAGMDSIPEERKKDLEEIASYLVTKKEKSEDANLIFICTHNSRRSHLSQIWAATAASYYGVGKGVFTFSGGTEATAFNPRAVAAVKRAGFEVEKPEGKNPHYQVTFSKEEAAMECFSKKYDDLFNPQQNFAAIMTCSHADENCPFIPGANMRIPIPYEDPKVADGTEFEATKYDERCLQIATEMFYMASVAKEKLAEKI